MARYSQRRHRNIVNNSGYSFIELLIVSVIILILASAVAPLSQVTVQRQNEIGLRRALREIRTAIDKYKDAGDLGVISGSNLDSGSGGYPPDLETLVEGVEIVNDTSGRRIKFLRRIPSDPITKTPNWRLKAYQDSSASTIWGGGNVYDVQSRSLGTALDGTRYRDW